MHVWLRRAHTYDCRLSVFGWRKENTVSVTHLARGYVRWLSILATIALMPFTKSLAIGGRVRAWSCPINVKQVHSWLASIYFTNLMELF